MPLEIWSPSLWTIVVSQDAILGRSSGGPAYIEMSPRPAVVCHLPAGASGSQISFGGADAQGKLYVSMPPERFQVVEGQSTDKTGSCPLSWAAPRCW